MEEGATVADFLRGQRCAGPPAPCRGRRDDCRGDRLGGLDYPGRIATALERIGLDAQPETLFASLSGGQRTRVGLAALIFFEPDFLYSTSRPIISIATGAKLSSIAGQLACRCCRRQPRSRTAGDHGCDHRDYRAGARRRRYGGNWSAFRERKAIELAATEHDLADAERRLADVVRSAQVTAERQARSDRAGRKKAARGVCPASSPAASSGEAENTSGNKGSPRRKAPRGSDAGGVGGAGADRDPPALLGLSLRRRDCRRAGTS